MAAIRLVAVGLARHGNRVFLGESVAPLNGLGGLYRPLGGSIEFGETGAQTVRREFLEEVGKLVTDVRYLATVENVFARAGRTEHEVLLVYRVRFRDRRIHEVDFVPRIDAGRTHKRAVWLSLTSLRRRRAELVPAGLRPIVLRLPP